MESPADLKPPNYDFKQLLALNLGDAAPVEDFIGPLIVANVPGKGRGVLVQRDVHRGELLFACKALAIAEVHRLAEATCERLRNCDTEDFEAFFLLCDGQHTPSDLPQLRTGNQGRVLGASSSAPRREVKTLWMKEVQAILSANAHQLDTSELCGKKSGKTLSGIFLLASLVNHSCRPNAARIFLGDMMFVRAARDIKQGEEVTDGYISVLQPASERRRDIREHYGFELTGDRILLEDYLFSEDMVQKILDRIDDSETVEDFNLILDDAHVLVASKLREMYEGDGKGKTVTEAVLAAERVGCGLERVLLGGLVLAVQVAVATIFADLDRHHEAAAAYSRCCWFMEELAPHNAYHAKWATEALLSASRARLPLSSYAGYARKVLEGHCGPGVLEMALGKSSSILKGLDTCFETCPPGEVEVTCPLPKDGEVIIQLDLPGPLSAQDLELSASPGLLDLSLPMQPGCPGLLPGCHGLLLVLPRAVAPHSAKARLSCGGRRLRVSFVAARVRGQPIKKKVGRERDPSQMERRADFNGPFKDFKDPWRDSGWPEAK